eukprot:7847324-Prorocentrum_lima.AAC.1
MRCGRTCGPIFVPSCHPRVGIQLLPPRNCPGAQQVLEDRSRFTLSWLRLELLTPILSGAPSPSTSD